MGATHIGVWSCLGRRKWKKIGALAVTRSPAPSTSNMQGEHLQTGQEVAVLSGLVDKSSKGVEAKG